MNTNTAPTKALLLAGLLCALLAGPAARATMTLGAWTPIYKGVELALGTNAPDATYPRRQAVFVMRLDLADPDLELVTDPPCTNNCSGHETIGLSTSGFLEAYKLQGAVNYSFFIQCCSATAGSPMDPFGLLVSRGLVVSPDWTPADVDSRNGQTYFSVLQFDANKNPTFFSYNWPAASLANVYTAIAGSRAILNKGVIVEVWSRSTIDPRVSIGISQDSRYLFLLVIDGRQGGYSDGANDYELGLWLKLAGVWNALNVDGGGSTAMARAECFGRAVQVNRPINNGVPGNERVVAGHFGFRAPPLPGFINDVAVETGSTTANVSWTTLSEATSRIEYGLTAGYGYSTPVDPTLTTNHLVQLTGLSPGTNYYIRVRSDTPGQQYWFNSCFNTTNNLLFGSIFGLDYTWKYATQNLDGIRWQATNYNDAAWPRGPGLLCIEDNPLIEPKGTILPMDVTTAYPFVTYYFRAHFNFTNDTAGASLVFSNILDDGAIFYLNGVEIKRVFLPLPPAVILNSTGANGYNCSSGDATCPYVFGLAGDWITNLVQGDNVVAVEVHNYNARSPDIVFGMALLFSTPPPAPRPFIDDLSITPGETSVVITWTTRSNATTQIQYGLTPDLPNASPLDATPRTNHTVALADLTPGQTYYLRVLSQANTNQFAVNSFFTTVTFYQPLVLLTNTWKYTTRNLDASNWTAAAYSETGWSGPARALFYVENNPDVYPKNTLLPTSFGRVYTNYYFRSHFTLTNPPAPGVVLLCTNLIDDGAVFYLNGAEVQRLRMPPAPQRIYYTNWATAEPPYGDAIYAEVFRVAGDLLTNLHVGDNLLAAEVHQYPAGVNDVVFGMSLGYARALAAESKLRVNWNGNRVVLSWDGPNFVLQRCLDLSATNAWADVPGPIRASPYTLTNPPARGFYRLRDLGQ